MPGLNTGHLFFITLLFILCFAFRVSRFALFGSIVNCKTCPPRRMSKL